MGAMGICNDSRVWQTMYRNATTCWMGMYQWQHPRTVVRIKAAKREKQKSCRALKLNNELNYWINSIENKTELHHVKLLCIKFWTHFIVLKQIIVLIPEKVRTDWKNKVHNWGMKSWMINIFHLPFFNFFKIFGNAEL